MQTPEQLKEVLWEHSLIDQGIQRYNDHIAGKSVDETPIGELLIFDLVPAVESKILDRQLEATQKLLAGRGRLGWHKALPLLDARIAAIVTVRAALATLTGSRHSHRSNRTFIHRLSGAFYAEVRFQVWMNNPDAGAERFLKLNAAHMNAKSAPARSRFKKRLAATVESVCSVGVKTFEDSRHNCSTGALLLDCLREAHPDLLKTVGTLKNQKITLSPEMLSKVDLMNSLAAQARPNLRPMLIPPRPWTLNGSTGSYEGGYYVLHNDMIRTSPGTAHRTRPSKPFVDAVNVVQSTAWRVNQTTLQFLLDHPELLPDHPGDYPHRDLLSREDYMNLSQPERTRLSQEWSDSVSTFDSDLSKSQAAMRRVAIAQELGAETLYFPHFADFRGRLYPIPSELNPQGDHISKGLLEFARGKRLGHSGLTALRIHFANCMGQDKASLLERELWSVQFLLGDGADRELVQVYQLADQPLSAVAAYAELRDATVDTVSHIPCAVDGVCNGLQHLSLMGKSVLGAEKTNCTDSETRQDLYSEVGEVVYGLLQTSDDPAAASWLTKFSDPAFRRKTCKRPLMTTPYSVTDNGIAKALVADRIVDDLPVPDGPGWTDLPLVSVRRKLATFMTSLIVNARAEVVKEAMRIMQYFKDVTGVLADDGVHLSWEVPDGLRIQQGYIKSEVVMVRTIDNLQRTQYTQTGEIKRFKSRSGSSPNIVHSLDACMLRMVALRLSELGITDTAMIHDSYGCHACDIETMNRVIREVAVEIYAGDWLLNNFHKELASKTSEVLELPPEQGTLDVEHQLPRATYFFS